MTLFRFSSGTNDNLRAGSDTRVPSVSRSFTRYLSVVAYALDISLYVSPGNLILQFKGYYFAKILKLRVSAPIIRTRPNWLITT